MNARAGRAPALLLMLAVLATTGGAAADHPQQGDCVGNPPRQDSDPLSPPCVPFFEGDNGGTTAQGVTADEVTVVFYNDHDIEGDLTQPWAPSDEDVTGLDRQNLVRTAKVLVRYFGGRYQSYHRRVRVIGVPAISSTNCAGRRADADIVQAEYAPFAVTVMGEGMECFVTRMADEHGVPTYGFLLNAPRATYDDRPGFVWSLAPDRDAVTEASAGFLCRALAGRPARHATDATLRDDVRSFGLIKPVNSQRGDWFEEAADGLVAAAAAQCGLTFDAIAPYDASGTGAGVVEAPAIMADFKLQGITTVVCYCIPVATEHTVSTMQNVASLLAYGPEWYWDPISAMDRVHWDQLYARRDHANLGTTWFWRSPSLRQQYAYQAYLTAEPETQPNPRWVWHLYHMLLTLSTAIQVAGPELTVPNAAAGLSALAVGDPSNPWVPAGSYGAPPSPHTFIDTAMAWWFDPTATPPGGRSGEGCLRVMDEGRRYTATTWPETDERLFEPGAPCTAPHFTLL